MRAVLLVAAVSVALAVSAVPRQVSADWPVFGRPISDAAGNQVHAVIATDGADGAIIAWQDSRNPRVNIFARHVLASGDVDVAWPADGRALLGDPLAMAGTDGGQSAPVIVPDGSGGAIVAWQDLRSAVTEFDVFAQHVLGSGVLDPAWPANGRAVVSIEGQQAEMRIAPDGAGGAFVTWVDSRPGASVFDIYAQRVLGTGQIDPRWPANGLAVCTAPGLQGHPVIIPDGAGGALISWDDGRSTTSGFDIYVHHVLGSGAVDPAWPADGRLACGAPGDQGGPTLASDGAGGAIVAWSDSRIVGTSHIFVQHVLALGTVDPAWPINGRSISTGAPTEGRALAVADGAGGAVVTWEAVTAQIDMVAQHVRASGVVDPVWPPGARVLGLSNRQQTHGDIAPDGAGGAIVVWEEGFDVVAQHVLASGALDPNYPVSGRLLVDLASQQGDPALVATGGAGAIVTWTDNRNGANSDIFAVQVLAVGTVDVPPATPPEIAFERPGPNPALGPVTIRFALPHDTAIRLAIYDAAGRRVRDLVSGTRPAGVQAVTWDLLDTHGDAVGPGLYFAQLEVEGRRLTRKITALR